jgi:hypothetical protein
VIEVENAVPAFHVVKRGMQLGRNRNVPTVDDIHHIPQVLRQMIGVQQEDHEPELFLKLSPDGPEQPNILIFTTVQNLDYLARSEHAVCDGNFKWQPLRPFPFAQFYTIHGFVRGEAVPLVFALLPDKS